MNKKILVIDDDVSYLSIVEHLLTSRKIEHKICRDAREGKGMIESFAPDVLLLDWMMPGISGLDLLKTIREEMKNRDLFVIMITAKMYSDDIVTAFAAGTDDYIIKPVSAKELIARIDNGVRIKHSREFNARNKGQLLQEIERLQDLIQTIDTTDAKTRTKTLQECRDRIAVLKTIVSDSAE